MTMMTYHGVVRGRTVLLNDEPVGLPDGTAVVVTPAVGCSGSAAALLAAIQSEPHLTNEDVDELERAIEGGHRQMSPPPSWSEDGGDA